MPLKYKSALILLLVSFLVACSSTAIKPDSLNPPNEPSCILLTEAISYSEVKGYMDIQWEYKLERGPYIAEKEDKEGVYFRAPPGGVFLGRPDKKDEPPSLVTHVTRDGGFFIPHDKSKQPRLYRYFSMDEAKVIIPSTEINCSSFAYSKDPNTSKISIGAFAIDGAAGGVTGRGMVPNSQMGYGQTAAAGAISGVIVAAIINADVGKIIHWDIADTSFASKLRELSLNAIKLEKIPSLKAEEVP